LGVRVLPESPIFFKKLPNQNFSATVLPVVTNISAAVGPAAMI
jgi:hypothetical protein